MITRRIAIKKIVRALQLRYGEINLDTTLGEIGEKFGDELIILTFED